MEEMRKNKLLLFDHPLKEMHGKNIFLFNIISWNLHICHFLFDRTYLSQSSLLCFTETKTGCNLNIVPVNSSNINEVIKTVLNLLFFFVRNDFARTKGRKSTKKHKKTLKAQKHNQAKT